MTLRQRSALRRQRIVAHRTKSFADADAWDLEFWQRQTPEARLSALVAIREDIKRVKGRNKAAAAGDGRTDKTPGARSPLGRRRTDG